MPNGVEFCSASRGFRETDEEENGHKRTQRTQKGRQQARTVRGAGLREPFRQNSKGHPVAEKPLFLRPLRSFAAILPGGLVSSIMFTAVGRSSC